MVDDPARDEQPRPVSGSAADIQNGEVRQLRRGKHVDDTSKTDVGFDAIELHGPGSRAELAQARVGTEWKTVPERPNILDPVSHDRGLRVPGMSQVPLQGRQPRKR